MHMLDRRALLVFLSVLTLSILSLGARFFAGPASLAFFSDDFFYYLKVAANIAAGHGSTFDSIHATNGYHPLWMLFLVAFVRILPDSLLFPAITAAILLSVLVTFWICLRFFSLVSSHRWTAPLCAAWIAVLSLILSSGGMEIVLAIPLAAGLCLFRLRPRFTWNVANSFTYALLGALTILARLDSILLVGPLFLLDICMERRSVFARWNWAALVAGFAPFYFYLGSNLLFFSTLLPVSGQAKQLRYHHWLSSMPLHGIFIDGTRSSLFLAWSTVMLLIAAVALLLSPRFRGQFRLPVHVIAVMLFFPVLHLLTLCLLSDWVTWPWYLYSILPAQIAALALLLGASPQWKPVWRRALCTAALALLIANASLHLFLQFRFSRDLNAPLYDNYLAAQDLKRFSLSHPGIYAQGDRAGLPAYMLGRPLLQIEGLMMDKLYLENIRRQRDLLDVLKAYGVRYYVALGAAQSGNCYTVEEPAQAGSDSPHMRGVFCSQPVAAFVDHQAHEEIFDLQAAQPPLSGKARGN